MKLTKKQVQAIQRKRGENGMSIASLARLLDLSPYTLYGIFNGGRLNVHPSTFKKLNDWIIDQYTTLK
ncbi:XRE family transcriptional regulator [Limosilactobacillus pontis]|uniref:helix-turn-helix domain-containing protein n=1 Tax=Limosilactobacillus pontis TaxID=35787 RepID=UPI0025A32863|nr:helix-turn-helix domain-containing protein [Limosilactobacillus pontis]MDM8332719.1 XRE family transcriptional regulator [Limosilactobacillus pontis]